MTINLTNPANHPANGPLTVERIIRVREELQCSLQYQNGGDMAYVIADAIKGLEELLGNREAVPVAWECSFTQIGNESNHFGSTFFEKNEKDKWVNLHESAGFHVRVTPLYTAPPAPVVEDGWIPVSERMPEREVDVQLYCADKKEQMVGYLEPNEKDGWFRFASWRNGDGVYCQPTHWKALMAAPQKVK